jgi:hypothetical protein
MVRMRWFSGGISTTPDSADRHTLRNELASRNISALEVRIVVQKA